MSTYSSHIETAKRVLLQQFCADKEIPVICKDHTTCLRWAIEKAGREVPKELK